MSELGIRTAQTIQQQLRELAESISACVAARIPLSPAAPGSNGYVHAARDPRVHLTYLIDALSVDAPALFVDYIRWGKVLYAGLQLPEGELSVTLECIGDLLQQHLPPAQGALVHGYVAAALAALPAAPSEVPSFLIEVPPFDALAAQYLTALLKGERDTAMRLILSAEQNGTPIKDLYLHVFQPVLREVGRLWQMHQISVAQEHYVTAATQLIMTLLSPAILATPKKGLRLVAVCVSNELHEVGARMVADFFEMAGWDTYYLGANTPAESVISAMIQTEADLLVISATLPTHVSAVAELIRQVRASAVKEALILVGGYPFNTVPDLWERIGADGTAPDAEAAVDLAEHLVTAAKIRTLREKHAAAPWPIRPTEETPISISPLYEEISRLNNELIDLHRELQKKNTELHQLIEDKNRLIGMASHDLRNPLTVILGYGQLVYEASTETLSGQQRHYLETIIASSNFMLKLVNDLLAASQLESGKLELELRPVDLEGLCRHVLEISGIQAASKEITLEFAGEPLPELLLDPLRIEQAVQNLIGNAVKFSDPGSRVELRLCRREREVRITVTDYGHGIPADKLEHIFTPFTSIDKTGTRGERGTGLGLAISKRIIEAHHGTIRVESTLGKGSTFIISLPLNTPGESSTQ